MFSDDVNATLSAIASLGAEVTRMGESVVVKKGKEKENPDIFAAESGTTLRLAVPVSLVKTNGAVFTGRARLIDRPMDEYINLFDKHGIYYEYDRRLPLKVEGKLEPGKYVVRGDVSSQYISGMLIALAGCGGKSTLTVEGAFESKPYVDMTVSALKSFGAVIKEEENSYYIENGITCENDTYFCENDYSQAAFFIVAGVLGGEIELTGFNPKSLQGDRAIIDVIKSMNGLVYFKGDSICSSKSDLVGVDIDARDIPDLVPIISLAASVAKGETTIRNVSRLRHKESDRLYAVTNELGKLGARITSDDNNIYIEGVQNLKGGNVSSHGDHRIAMMLAVASVVSDGEIIVDDFGCISKSYPGFLVDFESLGGKYE